MPTSCCAREPGRSRACSSPTRPAAAWHSPSASPRDRSRPLGSSTSSPPTACRPALPALAARRRLPARAPMNRRERDSGFALIELLVSMLVFLVVLLVTNGLLVESLRIFSNSGRELREPGTELALRLLREDLHASAPLLARSSAQGSLRALRPRLPATGPYRSLGDGRLAACPPLLRCRRRPPRHPADARRHGELRSGGLPAPGLVQVRLERRKPAGASALRVATAAWKSVGDTLEQADVVAGSRIDES